MGSAARPLMLVVEDSPACIYLWERYAGRAGYHVVSTGLGERALALAREERPDLIVLDLMLPGMDGWDVLHLLRGDPLTSDTPILVCSAFDERARALREDVDGYLEKPVHLQSFLDWLVEIGMEISG